MVLKKKLERKEFPLSWCEKREKKAKKKEGVRKKKKMVKK